MRGWCGVLNGLSGPSLKIIVVFKAVRIRCPAISKEGAQLVVWRYRLYIDDRGMMTSVCHHEI